LAHLGRGCQGGGASKDVARNVSTRNGCAPNPLCPNLLCPHRLIPNPLRSHRASTPHTCAQGNCSGMWDQYGQDLQLSRVKSIIRLGAPWGWVPGRWRKLHPHLQDATGPCAQSPSIDAIVMHVEWGHYFGGTAIVAEEQCLSLATRSRNMMGLMRAWLKYSTGGFTTIGHVRFLRGCWEAYSWTMLCPQESLERVNTLRDKSRHPIGAGRSHSTGS